MNVANDSIACALLLEDEKQLIEETRWFIKQHPFIADSYRLYSAMNRFCRGPTTYFNSGPEQKFVLRAVKAMDFSLLPREHRKQFGFTDGEREKWTDVPETGNPSQIVEHDPALLTLYGHMMFVAATYASALTYYFRAYVLRPDDPILNLCIGIAYIQMGYKRQAENRQYQIQQGLSFVNRYYSLRIKDNVAIKIQEAEFNMGLVWHTLGLQHLALPAYGRCMALSERVQKERVQAAMGGAGDLVEDLAAEAAFAVQGIMAMGGDFEGARRVTEQYLVL
jgi:general transcription factor 3C polypeptide 3 (transcription factor C subunit 4)